ncbi:MAG: DUF2029 domain-containing protein [Hyphomicrobiales bacterium]|nr:DUF2029 domain-containing protein [Hyphomicrobiales bacterium]
MRATLRSGGWLTRERVMIFQFFMLAWMAAAIGLAFAFTDDGMLANHTIPLGADFSEVWIAGREVLAGVPQQPYDLAQHVAAQRATFGPNTQIFGWHYPPYFLAPAAALARLPYVPALVVWQLATLAFYLAALFAILRDAPVSRGAVALGSLAFPAVFVNLAHGQNGFVTAALLGFGFLWLYRRPALAGVMFGLLAYKPHFALVLPFALIALRRWTTIASAAATFIVITGATIATYGFDVWRAFFDSLAITRIVVLEDGAAGFEKIQSVFAAVRMLGGGTALAYGAQGVVDVVALAALAGVMLSRADVRVKAATAILATLLTTPYALDYDMTAMAPAGAFLIAFGLERGFPPYLKTALGLSAAIPLMARPIAILTGIPVGAPACLLVFGLIVAAPLAGLLRNRTACAPAVDSI